MVFDFWKKKNKVENELQSLSKRIGAVEKDDSLDEIKSIIKTEFKVIEDTHKEVLVNAKEITKAKTELKAEKDKTKILSTENKELKKLLEKALENNEQLIKKVQVPKKVEVKNKVKVLKEVAKKPVIKSVSKPKTSQDIAKKVNFSVKTINDAAKKTKKKVVAKKTKKNSVISKISQESAKAVEA